ncbi:MAG TPA: PhoX family phosphatase, partial [Hyphomicrobium sp.]|nr:PhoX family phosphatase [Hyphomicrobium sp.]
MERKPVSTSVRLKYDEDAGSNGSENTTIGDMVAARLSRRDLGLGLLAVSVLQTATPPAARLVGNAQAADGPTRAFSFDELSAGSDATHHVADGYQADVLIRWGDRVGADAPQFDPLHQTAESQSKQFGYNNDFIGFLPIDGRSDHGLLVVNHEYTIEELMFPGLARQDKDAAFAATSAELVAIEMMAHGGSVIEIKRNGETWSVVENSRFARRITANTEMRISGPASGHGKLQTKADPTGTRVFGMLNNCAGATTPWGTWLTCEENINGYFWNKDALEQHPDAAALKRYGIPQQAYGWGKFHERFDIAKEPNEAHRFGWVVEIDPFDPSSMPVKRTALGRFKHEGAGNTINKDGRFVVYQGDDERFDYVYKFVTDDKVDLENPKANADILDRGTLYVARFNADGRGQWLALVHGQGSLTPELGFADQGTVVTFARQASDMLGATKMDRPEDIEVNPKTNKVYVMLTNNTKRKADQVDGANPRP